MTFKCYAIVTGILGCLMRSCSCQTSGFVPGPGASTNTNYFPIQADTGITGNNGNNYYGGNGIGNGGYYGGGYGSGYGNGYNNGYSNGYSGGNGGPYFYSPYTSNSGYYGGSSGYYSGSSSRSCAFGACFDPTITNVQGSLPLYNSGTTCSNGVCYSGGSGTFCTNGNCYATGSAASTYCSGGTCYTTGG